MDPEWLDDEQMAAWLRLIAVVELLPGVLDTQLRRDAGLSHFDYQVLAMLSEAPDRTLRMTALAARTNSTLPRLSHVVERLEGKQLIERQPSPEDRRATNAVLTAEGWAKVVDTSPGHLAAVRHHVIDALSPEQVTELRDICEAVLDRIDPDGAKTAIYRPRPGDGDTSSG